jgi:hypothetical protein
MSDFRTKLLGLAAMATMFAGASYGQILIGQGVAVNGSAAPTVTNGALNLRAEGTTEVVSPFTFTINNTGAAATGTITIFMSAPVTSLPGGFLNLATLATLTLAGGATNCAGPINGSASGTQLSFSAAGGAGCTFVGGTVYTATVQGVRVNASAVAAGTSLVPVTAQPAVVSNNSSSVLPANQAPILGYVNPSLSNPSVSGTISSFPAAPVNNYNTAQGNPAKGANTAVPSFWVFAGDSIAGAFKTWNGGPGVVAPAANTNFTIENADGNASYGTRIMLTFGNVPAGVTIYVPSSITSSAGAAAFNLSLVTSATAPDTGASVLPVVTVPLSFTAPTTTALPAVFGIGNTPITYGATFGITPSGGTATAVYEVASAPATSKVSSAIPVWVTFAPSALSAASGAITVVESYAPTLPLLTATTDPEFAPVTTPVLNGSSINLAQTQLLFPFVTSNAGFDTGIAISNTTTDPFGTSPTTGACNLNFYGSGAPTPSTGVAAPGGTQASGTSNAFLLSSVAPNFNGYMIAVCAYPEGHGFGYIIYNFGQNSGATMGYLATVLNRGPLVAVPAVESLGQ